MSDAEYPNPTLLIESDGGLLRDPLKAELKRWRLYYNCRSDFPFLAAVDNGTISTQIRVQHIAILGVVEVIDNTDVGPEPKGEHLPMGSLREEHRRNLERRRQRKGKRNEPTWWLEFEAYAVFDEGGVTFYGERR
jgi:hypothetical protein